MWMDSGAGWPAAKMPARMPSTTEPAVAGSSGREMVRRSSTISCTIRPPSSDDGGASDNGGAEGGDGGKVGGAEGGSAAVAPEPILPLSLQKWRTTRGSRWKHSSQGRVLAVTPMRRTSLWRRRRRRRCLRLCCRCAMLRHAVDIGLRHRILGALAGGVSGRSVRRAVRRRPVPSYSKEVSDPTESRQRGPSPRSCWRQMSCLDG